MRKRHAHGCLFSRFSYLDAILLVSFAWESLARWVAMMLKAILALWVGLIGVLAWRGDAMADGVKRVERGIAYERARFVGVRKRGPVRGYLVYRGGYSYGPRDVIDFYGARPQYWLGWDNQGGCCGPFDSGFFFDSSIRPHGGNAPYLN